MKIVTLVYHLDGSVMEGTVRDPEGVYRVIKVTWESKEDRALPEMWEESILREAQYRRSVENDKKKGRWIPDG